MYSFSLSILWPQVTSLTWVGFTKNPFRSGDSLEILPKLWGSLTESFPNFLPWSSLCVPRSACTRRGGLTYGQVGKLQSLSAGVGAADAPATSFLKEVLTLRTVPLLIATSALRCLFCSYCSVLCQPGLHLSTSPLHQVHLCWIYLWESPHTLLAFLQNNLKIILFLVVLFLSFMEH